MARVIIITGTPGTGKTTIARSLSKRLKGSLLIEVNDLIAKRRLFSGYDPEGARVVRMNELQLELNRIASQKGGTMILEGHILCDIKVKGAIAIVIREHLNELKKRLAKRNYGVEKIRDNLVSEAMNYCGEHSRSNYEKVYEIFDDKDSTKNIIDIINGKKRTKRIELLQELTRIIKENKKFAI